MAWLEPKCILAKPGDVPDGNETISSHLGLEPEGLGVSRWATFPRRASHGIGEFGQPKKGEVGWSGVERSGRHGPHYMYIGFWGRVGMGIAADGTGMVFYVFVGCRCVGKRRVDGMSTGSPGQAVMGQVLFWPCCWLPCTYCARCATGRIRHEHHDDDQED